MTYALQHVGGYLVMLDQEIYRPFETYRFIGVSDDETKIIARLVFRKGVMINSSPECYSLSHFENNYKIIRCPLEPAAIPALTFDKSTKTITHEIERATIELSDIEVRELIEKHLRDKYSQISDDHKITVLSIVPSMETKIEIWRTV